MPRRPRFDLPGVPQHVIQRGVDRQPAFFSDDDSRFYLDWLGEYARKRDIALHAYCLMTNHVHLLLSAPSAGALGGLMQDMGRRYVQYVNRSYRRSGGLWLNISPLARVRKSEIRPTATCSPPRWTTRPGI